MFGLSDELYEKIEKLKKKLKVLREQKKFLISTIEKNEELSNEDLIWLNQEEED